MLFTKTVCNAGSLVYVVPTGLLVTLHYDAHGVLSKVYQGINEKEELGQDFLKGIVRQGLVPSTIRLHGGATDIQGVFYSRDINSVSGTIPECEFANLVADIKSGNPNYRFFVGNVESGAMAITASSMQSWAKTVGFDALPCWAVPLNANDDSLMSFCSSSAFSQFEYPLIAGYFVFESQNKVKYIPTNLETYRITSEPVKLIDYDGNIKYGIKSKSVSLVIDYPEAVKYNVKKGSQVVLDPHTKKVIWSSTQKADPATRLAKRITCSSCHKILDVPENGSMTCSDPFCTSRLYPRIKRFCTILGLDVLDESSFDKAVKSHDIMILPDVLLISKYKEVKITNHLSDIILASIDGDVGISRDWVVKFCSKCNNSYDTVKYYFEGPRRIATELDMTVPPRLASWLSESRNLIELDTIIHSEQIQIDNADRLVKFEGAPVLRDKRVMITGTFLHGTLQDIIAIFQSYSATVVTTMDKKVDCVVVGDIKENIDGLAIQAARELDIPLFTESAFFARYSIDEDLEKFLK